MHEFCLIVGGESVAIRGGMKATFENKNDVFLVGDGSFLLHANAGKSWKIWKKQGTREFGYPVHHVLHFFPVQF